MKSSKELLKIASNSLMTVLIQGESGTGKEVAARFLHENSSRRGGPFVALNCGAIAKNLVESILEGFRKGAFTGAVSDQPGVVRAAQGGTLFLDEIGELPLECQSKLLRILQERAVLPVGATHSIPVDFRLVCATNRNLREDVAAGRFREDLFFRLNVFPVMLQPLREREDFGTLANEIWRGCASGEWGLSAAVTKSGLSAGASGLQGGEGAADSPTSASIVNGPFAVASPTSSVDELSAMEIALLQIYNWPGNIRQLKNVLQRYSLLKSHGISLGEILEEEYSELPATYAQNEYGALFERRQEYQYGMPHSGESRSIVPTRVNREMVESAIRRCGGNKVRAAKMLGISRSNLYLQMKK